MEGEPGRGWAPSVVIRVLNPSTSAMNTAVHLRGSAQKELASSPLSGEYGTHKQVKAIIMTFR